MQVWPKLQVLLPTRHLVDADSKLEAIGSEEVTKPPLCSFRGAWDAHLTCNDGLLVDTSCPIAGGLGTRSLRRPAAMTGSLGPVRCGGCAARGKASEGPQEVSLPR